MAGHSKWSNIKHRKARQDAVKAREWSKCSKAIMVAAKQGGPSPDMNITLRQAIDDARAVNMPKDRIEHAIRKGSGEMGGVDYERIVYEGYGPAGVAVLVEILTENRNRTAGEVRRIFDRNGGNLGEAGCVAYLFTARGQIFLSKDEQAQDEEAVMNVALEAGAEDVTDEGESWQVVCEPGDFETLREALRTAGLNVESAQVAMLAETSVTCSGEDARKVLQLLDALEDHDDVQKVHANFEIPDGELAALEG